MSFYLDDEFVDPLDVGLEVIDLGQTVFENIHQLIEGYVLGRPSRGPRLGIHTGEPYKINDRWSGWFEGA